MTLVVAGVLLSLYFAARFVGVFLRRKMLCCLHSILTLTLKNKPIYLLIIIISFPLFWKFVISNNSKMLRKKLKIETVTPEAEAEFSVSEDDITSKHFLTPFWKKFYDLEVHINEELKSVKFEPKIKYTYNPIEYASKIHCQFLRKYLDGQKMVMLIGMNPGPNGMAQTGVPFGDVITVRDWMKLEGEVNQPNPQHPKRVINGLKHNIEEPSGKRIWGLMREICGDLETFSKQCFMHNFCPLVFYDENGKSLTPSELKGPGRSKMQEICIKYLTEEILLVNPKIVIAIGTYIQDMLKILKRKPEIEEKDITFIRLMHPSPRSLNNTNWPEKAKTFFEENDLLKYLKNEV